MREVELRDTIRKTIQEMFDRDSRDNYPAGKNELIIIKKQLEDLNPHFTHRHDALKVNGLEITYDINSKEYEIINSSSGGKYYNKILNPDCHDCAFMKPEHVVEFVRSL